MKKSKRLLSLVLAMLMVISVFSGANLSAMAKFTLPENQVVESGQMGENAYYTFDSATKTLNITGTGDTMYVKVVAQCKEIERVEIASGITSIGHNLFDYCENLKYVYIPLTVTKIGENAFWINSPDLVITYEGTRDQLNHTNIGEGNPSFDSAQFVFEGKEVVQENYKNEWVYIDPYWYYYGDDGKVVTNTWMADSFGWMFLGEDGRPSKEVWRTDSNGWLYLGSDGYVATNTWAKDSTGWCYLDDNGRMVTDCWKMDSVGWCYIDSTGYLATNSWVADSWGWCYLDENGRMVKSSWRTDSAGWCYLDSNGYLLTNSWAMDSTGWCYVDGSGHMVTDVWAVDSYDWCYLDNTGHMAINTWIADSTGWCYLNSDGYITRSNWLYDNNNWYAFDGNGHMITGWFNNGTNWYYFDGAGHMMTGSQNIDGTDYYFKANGIYVPNYHIYEDVKVEYTENELRFLELINIERVKVGVAPLEMYNPGHRGAQVRANDLVESFSHHRPNGEGPDTAFTKDELWKHFEAFGENIAEGYTSPEDAMEHFMNSKPHRDGLLDPENTHFCCAEAVGPDGTRYTAHCFSGLPKF